MRPASKATAGGLGGAGLGGLSWAMSYFNWPIPPIVGWLVLLASVGLIVFSVYEWLRIFAGWWRGKRHATNRIREIDSLYAKAVEVRNKAASLRVLDAATESKMNELQDQLLQRMREVAPMRAINLNTLNTFDPRNHPRMLLQDPLRTLVFSEFLLRVKAILDDVN